MKRLFAVAALALVLLAACGGTDRPEGVVERWLISLNQGKAGEPAKYAAPNVTNKVLGGWAHCDPGALDVIEVGRARYAGVVLDSKPPYEAAFVPYRIKYKTDLSSRCNNRETHSAPLIGIADVEIRPHPDWTVVAIRARQPGDPAVPSEGGAPIGSAPAASWLITLAASVGLMLLVAALIRLTPKPAALPTTKR